MPTRYDRSYRPVVRKTREVNGQLKQRSARASEEKSAARDMMNAASVALKESGHGRNLLGSGHVNDSAASDWATKLPRNNTLHVRSARSVKRNSSPLVSDTTRYFATAPNFISGPEWPPYDKTLFGGSGHSFLPASAFSGLGEKVDALNSFTNNAFDIGMLRFDALAPTPPAIQKTKNSRYDVSPRHLSGSARRKKKNANNLAKEVTASFRSPAERAKQERIHAAITLRRSGAVRDTEVNEYHTEALNRNTDKQETRLARNRKDYSVDDDRNDVGKSQKSTKGKSIEKYEKLKQMQEEYDRLSHKKAAMRKRRIERRKLKHTLQMEREQMDMAAIKLQGLCRGRRDRIRVKQMHIEKEMREASSQRIQALYRGKADREIVRDLREKRDQSIACQRIQSLHRGRKGRKLFQERKDQEFASRKIQSVHRGRLARQRVAEERNEKRTRADASLKIQSLQRGRKSRELARRKKILRDFEEKQLQEEREIAVRKIQAVNRGRSSRQRVHTLKKEKQELEQTSAAQKIQAHVRGRQTRLEREEQSAAARKLQARVRGYQQRKKKGQLLVKGATHPEGVRLVALLDFEKEEPDDLEFKQGDILIGYSLEEGWWSGVKETDLTVLGDFPSNFVVREGEEANYELEVNNESGGGEGRVDKLPDAAGSGEGGAGGLNLPRELKGWLPGWAATFKIKGVGELGKALDAIGVGDVEDLMDLDPDMVDDACDRLKKLDQKKFRRAIEEAKRRSAEEDWLS